MERLRWLKPYGLMLVLIVGLSLLRGLLTPIISTHGPTVLYFIAVAVSAVYGGLLLTLYSTVLSALAIEYFFLMPNYSLHVQNPAEIIVLGLFVLIGIIFGAAGELHLRSRRRTLTLMMSLKELKHKAELSERTMHSLLESSSQGIFGIDMDGKIRIINGTAERMFGYEAGELTGQSIEMLIAPSQQAKHVIQRTEFMASSHERPSIHGMNLQGRHKNGSLFPIETLITATDTPTGRLGVSFVSDMTHPREMEASLLRERSELRSLIEHAPLLINMLDIQGNVHLANRSFAAACGMTEQEVLGQHISKVFPSYLSEKIAHSNTSIISSGKAEALDIDMEQKDGEWHTYHLVKFPLRYLDTDVLFGIGGIALDITELKKAEDKIRHAAQHDLLTGLPNRSLVYELGAHLINAAQRHQHKLAVMFFDLDRFKPVNDAYGHKTGDIMLQEVARRLQNNIRSSDLVGRLGGDEFVAILTELKSDLDLESAALHLLSCLREPYVIEALELHTSPSIGISLYPEHGTDIDLLIRRADAAMYHAKSRGRNNYQYFSEDILCNSAKVFAIEQRLRRSLHEENFELAYQPIINIASGKLAGVEALIRWRQSDGSELMPGEFIAAAEASGLIHQIGEWALAEACRQFERWCKLGLPPIRIAVNVSPIQFRSPDFRGRLLKALEQSSIDPCWLELEVTESTVMNRVEEATKTLTWLKGLGLRIALDDFGTGYSSLSHLAQLPIDKLKIDQSFITHMDTDSRSLAIAETVLSLGKKLGVEVVAEGIESQGALNLLRELGCNLGQGYLIGMPMKPEALEAWIAAQELSTQSLPA